MASVNLVGFLEARSEGSGAAEVVWPLGKGSRNTERKGAGGPRSGKASCGVWPALTFLTV